MLDSLDEFGDRWKSVLAGLLVLRLVDAWLVDVAPYCASRHSGIDAVREALSGVPSWDPVGPLLRDVVDRVEQSEDPRIGGVAVALERYAAALEFRSEWTLAHDVLDTVFRHARAERDFSTALSAGVTTARQLRTLGRWDIADTIIPLLEECARQLPDDIGHLRCHLARIYSRVSQGHFKKALEHLDAVTARIDDSGSDYVQFGAAHLRVELGWRTRKTDTALSFAYEALELNVDRHFKDNLLSNIAAIHMVAKRFDAAQAILLRLAETARPELVTASMANLTEIAIARADRKMFDFYRGQIQAEHVVPLESAYLHYMIGLGHRQFGQHRLGADHMTEALRLARAYKSVIVRQQARRQLKAWGINTD